MSARGAMKGAAWGVGALCAIALVPGVAEAQSISSTPPSAGRSDIGPDQPYWAAGQPRPFAAVVFESAGIGAKTELDLGFGRPHYLWAGLDIESSFSLRSLSEFAGLKAVAPWGFVRFGPRFVTSFSQKLIVPADVITRAAIDQDAGFRSKYLSLDAEASASIPLPVGSLGLLVTAYGVLDVVDDFYVFEDSLRVIIDPPFVGRARVSYLAGIGKPSTLRVGGVFEGIYNPAREMVNLRVGPAVAVSLTHHLEAVGVAAFSVYNPDEIGLAGADLGQIGLRYRWASGDLWPDFP